MESSWPWDEEVHHTCQVFVCQGPTAQSMPLPRLKLPSTGLVPTSVGAAAALARLEKGIISVSCIVLSLIPKMGSGGRTPHPHSTQQGGRAPHPLPHHAAGREGWLPPHHIAGREGCPSPSHAAERKDGTPPHLQLEGRALHPHNMKQGGGLSRAGGQEGLSKGSAHDLPFHVHTGTHIHMHPHPQSLLPLWKEAGCSQRRSGETW